MGGDQRKQRHRRGKARGCCWAAGNQPAAKDRKERGNQRIKRASSVSPGGLDVFY